MHKITSRLLSLLLLCSAAQLATAQQLKMLKRDCLQMSAADASDGNSGPSKAPLRAQLSLKTQWDSTRTYPVAVVLVSFSDLDFSAGDAEKPTTMGDISDIAERYQRLFNEQGFNRSAGPGCVRDYFVDQSGGLFHPRFDIYGPVKVTSVAKANNSGSSIFRSAVEQLVNNEEINLGDYDWDGNGKAEAIIFVYAGYGGNDSNINDNRYIWPNTGTFRVLAQGNTTVTEYSASPELWYNDRSCGIGTICHEYCHTLGLPDIYPTGNNDVLSVCDEWDLMDGGNYTNQGWCPPYLTAHERMILGWTTPEELSESVTVTQMKPVSEGGPSYIVRTNSPSEFFLLENRQWSKWDTRAPGHGLLITHVDYDETAWGNNTPNYQKTHRRFVIVHADNMDYDDWDELIGPSGSVYVSGHSRILSTSPYPFVSDTVENRALTDSTTPAATTYCAPQLLQKPITGITEDADGTVSFHFMGGTPSGISVLNSREPDDAAAYDLHGRRVGAAYRGLVVKGGRLRLQ